MWRSKKFLLVALLLAVVLVGGTAGIVLAQGSGDDNQSKTLLARVAEKLGIDQQQLEDAVAEARSEMRDEALDSYLQNLVDEGRITREEADQYKEWLQSRPGLEQYRQQLKDWRQARPGIPPEVEDWQQARPDIPLPGPFGGRGLPGGMRPGGGFHFWGR